MHLPSLRACFFFKLLNNSVSSYSLCFLFASLVKVSFLCVSEELAHLQSVDKILAPSAVWTKPFGQPMNTSSNVAGAPTNNDKEDSVKCFHPDTIGLSGMLCYFPFPSKPCQNGEASPRGAGKTANSTSYIQSDHKIHGKIQMWVFLFG